MRLLNINTLILSTFDDFGDARIPHYAIASHRWFSDEDEVSFQDMLKGGKRESRGFKKIEGFCTFLRERNTSETFTTMGREHTAATDRDWMHIDIVRGSQGRRPVNWLWIDTCCIDKQNSVELQEAINSMYKWYRQAWECYVYLSDASSAEGFVNSLWFARGWTLQELLAPKNLVFLNSNWDVIGHKCPRQHKAELRCVSLRNGEGLNARISLRTGIPEDILENSRALDECPITERVKWARERITKKREDMAYCLLGICGVFMPLIYGEGNNAWRRLEEAVSTEYGGQKIRLPMPPALRY